ncbi:hypothetical protein WA026_001375 [Henosepilachna vigintioctopunctata]|uniref:Fucosyltransferase n=1 Tax=Henosepilachna vigintioctopunctata TaxID=420089 RepID=A0AAW1UQS1_9CUCU
MSFLRVQLLAKNFISKRIWLILLSLIFLLMLLMEKEQSFEEIVDRTVLQPRKYDGSWRNLTEKEKRSLSVLGRILYLEEDRPPQQNRTFLILFWKYGKYIKNRHLNFYSGKNHDPLESCSVKNCAFSFNDKDLKKADMVVSHLHRMKGVQDLPSTRGNLGQIWAFLTDESPFNTFLASKVKLSDFNGKFNWSMSYRMDSDVPVPYGRTRKFSPHIFPQEEKVPKRRDKLVAILGSNCGGRNHRWNYVKKLNMSIEVDVFGGCGNKTACPGHFKSDCPAINSYLFYLSFENSNCNEYITEKVFWNAYHKNSIPIIMGYDKKTYEKLLPPRSFLHVDDFASPKDLADFIISLNKTDEYKSYFRWKTSYEILNEHGYFKTRSYHFCRICEALNFNEKKVKQYNDIETFWSQSKDCSVR